ncbi:MAG: hypothetical protein IK091_00965 [Spirochaetales bacterium]|nr:hypothetical protein [Spirochaetales bacterium]
MKKFIPLLIICLAVLCLLTSCGEIEKLVLEGTWKSDYQEGFFYCTEKAVFSSDEVQMIKIKYKDKNRRFVWSSEAMAPMPYTIGEGGTVTINYSVGVMKEIAVTDTFTLDETTAGLIWNRGYFQEQMAFEKESNDADFVKPVRAYEQYLSDVVMYWEPGETVTVDSSSLFLYSDGEYSWEGSGRTVSRGKWIKNTAEPNKITLINDDGWAFDSMDLEYIVDSEIKSHLHVTHIEEDYFDMPPYNFDYYSSWYVEFYR